MLMPVQLHPQTLPHDVGFQEFTATNRDPQGLAFCCPTLKVTIHVSCPANN
jgi:hypothetical protein